MLELDKVYNMDCVDGLKQLDDNSIDLVVTSPPYDNLITYDGYSFDFYTIASELYRVIKDGGVVVWIVSDSTINGSETGTSFKQALYFKEIGFNLHDTMIWKKDTASFPDSVRYSQNFEYMFIFSNGPVNTFNPIEDRKNKYTGTKIHGTYRNRNGSIVNRGERWCSSVVGEYGSRFNVWEIPSEKNNNSGHPAVFPESIAKDHIISWSNEGDIVLDPFIGSGTTASACIELNRHYIGFEISSKYFSIANERIEKSKDRVDGLYKSIDNKTGNSVVYRRNKIFDN